MTHAMTVKHHLTDDLLMAYSAGDLPEAVNLIIATHISMCDDCRAALESFDAVGGAVLDTCEKVAMSKSSLTDVLNRIHAQDSAALNSQTKPRATDSVLPAPLLDYVAGGLDKVKWRPVGMGVKQDILSAGAEGSVQGT